MKNLFRSKFSPIGMVLDIVAAPGKRRIFYAFQTLVMLGISLLAVYGLKVMFNYTINEDFILFVIGTFFCVLTLILVTLPVLIASGMLFIVTLIGSFKKDERGANLFSFLIVTVAIILTIVFLILIFSSL